MLHTGSFCSDAGDGEGSLQSGEMNTAVCTCRKSLKEYF